MMKSGEYDETKKCVGLFKSIMEKQKEYCGKARSAPCMENRRETLQESRSYVNGEVKRILWGKKSY